MDDKKKILDFNSRKYQYPNRSIPETDDKADAFIDLEMYRNTFSAKKLQQKIIELKNYKEINESDSIIDISPEDVPIPVIDYDFHDENTEYYSLGTSNKERLGLTDKEEWILNLVWYNQSVFTAIEQCCDETIRLFLYLINEI